MRSKRGFTVAELCIALALTLIVAAMATTLCFLASGSVERITRQGETSAGLSGIDTALDSWLLSLDDSQYAFVSNGSKLTADSATDTYYLQYSDGVLVSATQSGCSELILQGIDGIDFEIIDASLIKCTVHYNGKTLPMYRKIKSKR